MHARSVPNQRDGAGKSVENTPACPHIRQVFGIARHLTRLGYQRLLRLIRARHPCGQKQVRRPDLSCRHHKSSCHWSIERSFDCQQSYFRPLPQNARLTADIPSTLHTPPPSISFGRRRLHGRSSPTPSTTQNPTAICVSKRRVRT